jgi:hypothetical protein
LIEHDLFGKPLHTFPDHAQNKTARLLVADGRLWSPQVYGGMTPEGVALDFADLSLC